MQNSQWTGTFPVNFTTHSLTPCRPKPLKPYSPSLDKLYSSKKARDLEIENKLHPKLPTNLPREDESAVDRLLLKRGVVAKFGREQVVDKDIQRLRPGQWLNDEIINYYGQMILSRSETFVEGRALTNAHVNGKQAPKHKFVSVHYFNTFFWTKLKMDGYEKGRLAKWTKKVCLPIVSSQKDVLSRSRWTSSRRTLSWFL